jgi:hypothetical protein
METEHDRVPDLNDATKWFELEARKEVIYGKSGNLIVPIGAKRYYREIKNNKVGFGASMSLTIFEEEPCLIFWNYVANDKKTGIGFMALRMNNKKWAISNILVNGLSIEIDIADTIPIDDNSTKKDTDIVHYHIYDNEAWIFLKAKKGWAIRKIKKAPRN